MLAPEQQAQLDELYWQSKQTASSLAVQFGLTTAQMAKHVTPLPAGFDCWWCSRPVVFRTRSDRDSMQRRHLMPRCECGAEQPRGLDHPGLVPSDAVIVVPVFEPRDDLRWRAPSPGRGRRRPQSDVTCLGVAALAEVGLRWCGQITVVEAFDSVDEVLERITALPTGVIVVPSLTDLMRNEGDSLALFFRLVLSGRRVISAAPARMYAREYDGWSDDLADHWSSPPTNTRHYPLRLL